MIQNGRETEIGPFGPLVPIKHINRSRYADAQEVTDLAEALALERYEVAVARTRRTRPSETSTMLDSRDPNQAKRMALLLRMQKDGVPGVSVRPIRKAGTYLAQVDCSSAEDGPVSLMSPVHAVSRYQNSLLR